MWKCLIVGLCWILPLPLAAQDLVVFAASSLKQPLDQIAAEFEGVVVAYGGSGTQARQISLGAPADVVLLANQEWMDVLRDGGHIRDGSDTAFLSNRLVLVGTQPVALEKDAILATLGDRPLAMGFVKSVPAGQYGKAAFETLGLWDAIRPHVAEVDNVRAALALVSRGEAPLGVVYASDAVADPSVQVAAVFPASAYPPIRYLGAVTAQSVHPAAQAFLDALSAPEAQTIFAKAGFLPFPAP